MLIQMFDPHTASEREWLALHQFTNACRAEAWPEDLPLPLEWLKLRFLGIPANTFVDKWMAWNEHGEALGTVEVWTEIGETNQHMCWVDLTVLPAYRRQGLATRLLGYAVEAAQRRNRRLVVFETDAAIPAGLALAERLGATKGIEAHTNQLVLAELDRDLVQAWQARAPQRAPGFLLEFIEGPYPEADLENMIELFALSMNDEPRGDLEIEDERPTPAQLREWEESNVRRRRERWVVWAREVETGILAGYSTVYWSPFEPDTVQQAGTGVRRDYRCRGLGRWLKAAMLDKILRERPGVKRVRTGNADTNVPMLKINHELGFKPYKAWTEWQIAVDKLAESLAGLTELEEVAA